MKLSGGRKPSADKTYKSIAFRVRVTTLIRPDFIGCIKQEGTKKEKYAGESGNKFGANDDKNGPQNKRNYNSNKQYPMLVHVWYREGRHDDQEDEKVVNTK